MDFSLNPEWVSLRNTGQITELGTHIKQLNEEMIEMRLQVDELKFQIEELKESQKKDIKLIRENVLELNGNYSGMINLLFSGIDALTKYVPTFSKELTHWVNQLLIGLRTGRVNEVKGFRCSKSLVINIV